MSDILDTIDNALEDWGTSDDAMRWRPEPADALTGVRADVMRRLPDVYAHLRAGRA